MSYKPRYQSFNFFDGGRTILVDTRRGKSGLYPGDEIKFQAFGLVFHVLIIGYADGFLWVCDTRDISREVVFAVPSLSEFSCDFIKRHGQHLIDKKEMIQI
jgi:hypothetical protein